MAIDPDLAARGPDEAGLLMRDAAAADGLAADVGALPDIGRREPGGWLVPAAALALLAALPAAASRPTRRTWSCGS